MQAGRFVDSIESIECTNHDRSGRSIKTPRVSIGSRQSTRQTTRCPARTGSSYTPDRAAFGLVIHSGWLTDGFSLVCDLTNG